MTKMARTMSHRYMLPDGSIVPNQKEGCFKLGIGRNAFRNRVKSGVIKQITMDNKPNGYYDERVNSTIR